MDKKKAVYNYINDYQKEKYDRITILRKTGDKEYINNIAKEHGYRTITEFINSCIDDRLANYGLCNNTEYLSNVTESTRTNENEFDDKIIDSDIKIDFGAFKKHVPTEEEETDNRMRLLKLQEEINARKTYIIKPVEQEPTLTDIQLSDKPPF
mgnify:CR=1 FL=1|jgi:hypothetical protein|nr:MAG TPA: hypothetical protein [Bacteriophage sp.]